VKATRRLYGASLKIRLDGRPKGELMKTDRAQPGNIDAYIAAFPREVQSLLNRVRNIIRKAVPGADEGISYGIPTYKLHGRPVIYFAAWKQHYSLYPSSDSLAEAFRDELSAYEVNKGTIRFPLSEPVPAKLIAAVAKFRAKEVREHEKARSARSRTARPRTAAPAPRRTTRAVRAVKASR
jgi:uncharacterized protein YdhG (YjbR/CyaY superfamily)